MASRSAAKVKPSAKKAATRAVPAKAKPRPKVVAKAKPAAKAEPKAGSKAKPAANAKPANPVARPTRASGTRTKAAPVADARDRARLLRDGERFGPATVSLHPLPALHVPSGKIVTCDPFTAEGCTLAREVPAGTYPVTVAVATFPHSPNGKDEGDQRVAAAFLRLGDGEVARWQPADPTDPPAAPRDPAAPGYRIDALTGAFADARAFDAITREPPYWPTPSYAALEPQLLGEHFTPTWSWAAYQPEPGSPGNCVAFTSGWGPGTYRSYWGLDAAGTPAVLLTDFDVFSDAEWR